MSGYNPLVSQVEPSTSVEENDADKLIEENNKLREQNLKLQKILAIAGVKFDGEISAQSQQQSVTYTPASSTFSSDIQDLNVTGGCQQGGSDDDYGSISNNNVECSTDVITKSSKNKRSDEDRSNGSEILLCDTSTNIDFVPLPEDQNTENDLFAELQVDTTVDIRPKSSSFEDHGLTITLPSQSNESDNKINSQIIRPGTSYLNPDGIVDISPPLPLTDHNCFPGSSVLSPNAQSSAPAFSVHNSVSQNLSMFGQQPSLSMANGAPVLNIQRMDSSMQLGGPLSLVGGFNNGILINQQVSFLPQHQQPQNILLNPNSGIMNSQAKILSPNGNILPQSGNLITHQGNLLMQNGNGIFQQFAQPVSSLNLIPQATPLFSGSQMKATPVHGPMTLNVVPQNSGRDFLMLPNGKLVPISTQPSILPVAPSHPAMQSIITGFSNQIRFQTPQFLGGNSIQRCSQPFNLLPPHQMPLLGPPDQARLTGQNQISVNGLPVLAPGQLPQTLQIFNQLPQVSPQQNIGNSSMAGPHTVIPPQNFVYPSVQPCMTAYLTPEGTIVLSLHQQTAKKVVEDVQKSSQSVNNNFLQEKKVQRRIMPKPPTNESILNSNLNAISSTKCSTLNCHVAVSSSSNDANDVLDKGTNALAASNTSSAYPSGDYVRKNLQAGLETSLEASSQNHDDISVRKKGSGRKRELGSSEKKKRVKAIPKSDAASGVISLLNTASEKSDLSELQDISCCILNESLNDHFAQNLNDDDQGDINQFSDLIVMDNEVTSNPKTNLEENILPTTTESLQKSSEDNIIVCESVPETMSMFSVSSTTASCSENVIFPTSSNADGSSVVVHEKKVKKKKKKANTTGLLMIEPIAEVTFQKNSPPAQEVSHLDNKCEDHKASQDFMRAISSSLAEPSISSSVASNPAESCHLSDSSLLLEEQKDLNSDSIFMQTASEQLVAYPMPDRVEEGTQTIKLERRKRNRSNKKSKNKTCSIDTSKRECDSNINDAVTNNIPDKLSFLEDQLMDVVDKVESLVAQSVMTPIKDFPENIDTKYEIKDTQFCKSEEDELDITKLEPSIGKRKQHNTTEDKPMKKLKLSSKGESDFWEIKHSSHAIENQSVKDCSGSVLASNDAGTVSCNTLTSSLENSLDVTSSRNLNDNFMSGDFSSPLKKGKKQRDVAGDKLFCDGMDDKISSKQIISENNLVKSIEHVDYTSQTGSKESLASADSFRSARHTSIASLALSSGNVKVSITKSNVTKTTKCHQINEDNTQSEVSMGQRTEVDCECDLAKTVDSIVEELDKTLHQVKQNAVIQDNMVEISDQKCSGNKKDGAKPSNVILDLETKDNKLNQKVESKFVNSETKTSSWSSSNNMCTYQMPTTISSSVQRCHSNSDESMVKCSHNKNDSDVSVNDHLVPSALQGPSVNACYIGRTKNGHDVAIDSSSKSAELEIYRNDKSSTEKFPASIHSSSYKELNGPPCLKLESNIANEETDKKSQASLLNAISKNNENMMSHNAQNSRQKSQVKMEQQISKLSRQSSESANMGATNYYAMDESGKKFGYPNIFAPPLFTDPYSSSCAQFSTFPVSGGPSFEPGFMLPPCIPFDGPVASAGFNYYGDSTRYSHFGHSSLSNKNHHSFSSIAPDYPSCSLEPKKMPINSNFNDRSSKDETLKNKLNNPRKDLFIPPDIPLDQFIIPCASSGDKQNMSQNMDGAHSGTAFMNSGGSKSYPASKQDAQSGNRNSKSSNTIIYNRNPSNPLVSPPLHHHPLLFDQKNSGFATGFDFSFNSSNLNTLMNGCGIMDQSFVSTVSNSFNNNYNRDCGNTSNGKGIGQEEKKIPINKNNSLANNKMYDASTKSNTVVSSANLTLTSSSTSASQPKSVSKSTRSSKKASTAKTNTDNNSCMFSQTQASTKCNPNTEVMSYFANNFNSSLPCRTSSSTNETSKFQSPYATGSIALSMGSNTNNLGLRTSASIGMDYMSTQILGSSGSIHSHHHPHFGFNHFFPEMDIPNGYLKFSNHGVGDLETMPLHHQHKNTHQPSVPNQSPHSVLSDINPFFHPPQYSFDGSSSYFNQSACSASPFTMSSLNIRMPRMYHQNNNTF